MLCIIASFVNSLWALPPLCTVGTAAALYCMLCTAGTTICVGAVATLYCMLYALRVLPQAWVLLPLYTVCYYICTAGTATSMGTATALYCMLLYMHCGYCHKHGYCRRFILYAIIYALQVLPQAWVLPPLYTVCYYICTAGTATSMGTATALYCMLLYMHCGYCHKHGYCRRFILYAIIYALRVLP